MGALEIGEGGPSTTGGSGVILKMVLVASIAAGVQFGWALQLSLLTPYTQLLGVAHQWAAIVWLCGPISGLVVQPIAGYYSDKCTLRFGRRRPFIAVGSCLVILAVFLIGFAADWGHAAGDDLHKTPKPRAVFIFVIGFWILDCANNMMQGPCRALLADLSEGDSRKISTANTLFSFFMAVGNVLGYAAGSYTKLYTFFPFSYTDACQVYCANLKSCFFISVALLMTVTILALTVVHETPFSAEQAQEAGEKKMDLIGALKGLPKAMWILMLVTFLNWLAWFPFLLFDTDWMGREVYGGDVGETIYDSGVRAGSLGLMLNSVVLAFASLAVQKLATGAGRVKKIWGGVNFLLGICLFSTVWITRAAREDRYAMGAGAAMIPTSSVKTGALTVFAILGIPLSVTFSLPFALASIYSSEGGSGQGLSLGLLNLAIVVPQIIVSVSSGPLDQAFGGGNLPAFVFGGIAAGASAVCALVLLPATDDKPLVVGMGGGH